MRKAVALLARVSGVIYIVGSLLSVKNITMENCNAVQVASGMVSPKSLLYRNLVLEISLLLRHRSPVSSATNTCLSAVASTFTVVSGVTVTLANDNEVFHSSDSVAYCLLWQ